MANIDIILKSGKIVHYERKRSLKGITDKYNGYFLSNFSLFSTKKATPSSGWSKKAIFVASLEFKWEGFRAKQIAWCPSTTTINIGWVLLHTRFSYPLAKRIYSVYLWLPTSYSVCSLKWPISRIKRQIWCCKKLVYTIIRLKLTLSTPANPTPRMYQKIFSTQIHPIIIKIILLKDGNVDKLSFFRPQ